MPQTAPIAGRAALPAFTPGHLYVAQGLDIRTLVYRFPLNAKGLAATKPDGKLALHFPYPDAIGAIAVGDPDGDLYVSNSGTSPGCRNESKCYVEVFAPGALGSAKPIRKLYVPQQPLFIAVDQRGYLDVSVLEGGGNITLVYEPDASGQDKPISEIVHNTVEALAASRGVVYVQQDAVGVGVEAVREHSTDHQPIYYTYGDNYPNSGVATADGHLYAEYDWVQRRKEYLAAAVFSIGKPGLPLRSIVGTGCEEGINQGGELGYGVAVYKNYIYEGCIGPGGGGGVVIVYDITKNGMQHPIEQLSGGNAGVAIGP
jgi:hypothetical protein